MPLDLQNQPLTLPVNTEFPGTMQDLLNLIAQYLLIAGQADFSGINFGATTPSPSDQDRPWFQTDSSGNPIGWFTWGGSSWIPLPVVPQSGVFASAPSSGQVGQQYYATDLGTTGTMLMWNGTMWVTVDGCSGDIKFVSGTDTTVILANNPGWTLLTAEAAYVFGVAGDGTGAGFSVRTPGQTVGEETHALTAAENGPHTHTYQGYGNLNGTSGANPIFANPVPTQTDAGGSLGTPHNNMQPTWFLYCLQKL
jgi:hypothetical protein